jgi:hypothetical protein
VNCAKANEDAMSPTYSPVCPSLTSGNDFVISGRYGLIELRAVCSARAMTASTISCLVGRGDSWWLWLPSSERLPSWPDGESDGGRPRDLGGMVGKVV